MTDETTAPEPIPEPQWTNSQGESGHTLRGTCSLDRLTMAAAAVPTTQAPVVNASLDDDIAS